MRVLLDESLPRQLAPELVGHETSTVAQQRWQGLKNGRLLARAEADGFDALVTADQNIEYQQNLEGVGVGIIVLAALTNRIEDLLPLVPALLEALSTVRAGEVLTVRASWADRLLTQPQDPARSSG